MNQGIYNNTQILQPQTINLMQTEQINLFGNAFGGYSFDGWGLGWPIYLNNFIGHGGACPGYLTQIAFKTATNSTYGIIFSLNRGASLVEDDYLVNEFLPLMNKLLFEEAATLAAI